MVYVCKHNYFLFGPELRPGLGLFGCSIRIFMVFDEDILWFYPSFEPPW